MKFRKNIIKKIVLFSFFILVLSIPLVSAGITPGSTGAIKSSSITSTTTTSSTCNSLTACKEIDSIWNQISSLIVSSWKGYIWNKENQVSYDSVWGTKTTTPTTTPVTTSVKKVGSFGTNFKFGDTTYLSIAVKSANSNFIDPCYVLTVIHEESRGNVAAIGNDANVPYCTIKSRRLLLMDKSPNCKTEYKTQEELMTGCNANKASAGDRKPAAGKNDCLDDFLNTAVYRLKTPSKTDFCNNQFDAKYTWGIGLGQITLLGKATRTIGGITYTACDLFNPTKNIKATIDLLKSKGAGLNQNEAKIKKVFGGYGSSATSTKRYNLYSECKNINLGSKVISSSSSSTSTGQATAAATAEDVDYFTYQSKCTSSYAKTTGRTVGVIIPKGAESKVTATANFFFHGHMGSLVKQKGNDFVDWFFNGFKIENQMIDENEVLIILTGSEDQSKSTQWMGSVSNEDFSCIFKEAIAKLNNKLIIPTDFSLIGHSNGGSAIKNIVNSGALNKISLSIKNIAFFDACASDWCTVVHNNLKDKLNGKMYVYYPTSGSTTKKVSEDTMKKKSGVVVEDLSGDHNSIIKTHLTKFM